MRLSNVGAPIDVNRRQVRFFRQTYSPPHSRSPQIVCASKHATTFLKQDVQSGAGNDQGACSFGRCDQDHTVKTTRSAEGPLKILEVAALSVLKGTPAYPNRFACLCTVYPVHAAAHAKAAEQDDGLPPPALPPARLWYEKWRVLVSMPLNDGRRGRLQKHTLRTSLLCCRPRASASGAYAALNTRKRDAPSQARPCRPCPAHWFAPPRARWRRDGRLPRPLCHPACPQPGDSACTTAPPPPQGGGHAATWNHTPCRRHHRGQLASRRRRRAARGWAGAPAATAAVTAARRHRVKTPPRAPRWWRPRHRGRRRRHRHRDRVVSREVRPARPSSGV